MIGASLVDVTLQSSPVYTALSYTWGDSSVFGKITVDEREDIGVGESLWNFLDAQTRKLSEPKLFWVDAICIDQTNVHERNYQVGLMKQIYTYAANVCVWLGPANQMQNSDLAMEFLSKKASRQLRPRGMGFHHVWSREEGDALRDLCERSYWKRMWISKYFQPVIVRASF